MGFISKAFNSGKGWMIAILIISILSLAIMIERFIFLFFRYNINAEAFMQNIRKLVMAGNVDRAIKMCNASPTAAVPRVVKAGLMRANKGEVAIQNAIEEARLDVEPEVRKRTGALLVLANVATLLGLLGTIAGLILAFDALADAPEEERQNLLASGISVAMYTTAFGLIVAIPTLLGHLVLSGFTRKIIDEVDHYSVALEDLLVTQARGGAAAE